MLCKTEEWITSLGIWFLSLLLIVNVFAREMGESLYFAEEVGIFLIIVITFLGLGYAVRQAKHIRMAAITDMIPTKAAKAMAFASALMNSLTMLFLVYLATLYMCEVRSHRQITPALAVPYWVFLISIPVGFLLAGVQYALTFARNVSEKEIWASFEKLDEYAEDP